MLESWKLKDLAYQEVAHLPLEQAIRKRIDDSTRSANNFVIETTKRRRRQKAKH
jgi:hypothetical protein